MIPRPKEDKLCGAWVGPASGVTNEMLSEAGLEEWEIDTLRRNRFVASEPAPDAPLTLGEAAELVREIWEPNRRIMLRLPEKWLKASSFPVDYTPRKVRPSTTLAP